MGGGDGEGKESIGDDGNSSAVSYLQDKLHIVPGLRRSLYKRPKRTTFPDFFTMFSAAGEPAHACASSRLDHGLKTLSGEAALAAVVFTAGDIKPVAGQLSQNT